MSWCDDFRHIIRPDVPLAPLTWYRLGGAARWLCEPRTPAEAVALLAAIRAAGAPWRVLGRGANVLVADRGFDGAVIRLVGPEFERVTFDGPCVSAAAGADLSALIRDCIERGLVGLEALAGVPATVGGAVRMNAGGRHGEVSAFVTRVHVLNERGERETRSVEQAGFGYRRSRLEGCVVLAADLRLAEGNREEARRRHSAIWKEKAAAQPPLSVRSAGCVFKNPPGQRAGKLLDEAGVKGLRVGGAQVSERHANFIVVHEGARAQDVLDLAEMARQRVLMHAGVELELELDVWN
ncbi:MAG: UDP-N-acetylmuramate dehydrogenase [Phycisphaerae bacterium]|nr:UDP-N-acetylmuramate dehydrogenase [Phycisphaerae bacterium]MCZ2400963.1 UDP-N-acetylmuramate dehydrogenase [Phycisphaerae bacterium]